MIGKVLWIVAGIVPAVIVGVGLRFAGDAMLLSGGSDALTTVVAPPVWAQLAGALFAGVAIALPGVVRSGGWRRHRWWMIPLALVIVLFSGHRLVMDGARGELRDVYWLVDVKRVAFDVDSGPGRAFSARFSTFFLELQMADSPKVHRVFLGVPPWRLPVERLSNLVDANDTQ